MEGITTAGSVMGAGFQVWIKLNTSWQDQQFRNIIILFCFWHY